MDSFSAFVIESTIDEIVDDIFPDLEGYARFIIRRDLLNLMESKDLGKFKGDISVFKQRVIDVAGLASVNVRRTLEKDTAKKLDKVVATLENSMNMFLRKFRSNTFTKTMFRKKMKAALRVSYTDVYRLGSRAVGLETLATHMGPDEKRWLTSVLTKESKYFNKFLSAVVKGESVTKSKGRIKNYANAIRSVYDASRIIQLPDNVAIHWILQSGNPCPECRLLARLSPFVRSTLPTTPKGGATRCLSYCYCKLKIVKTKPGKLISIARRNKSAEYLLKQLKKSRAA